MKKDITINKTFCDICKEESDRSCILCKKVDRCFTHLNDSMESFHYKWEKGNIVCICKDCIKQDSELLILLHKMRDLRSKHMNEYAKNTEEGIELEDKIKALIEEN